MDDRYSRVGDEQTPADRMWTELHDEISEFSQDPAAANTLTKLAREISDSSAGIVPPGGWDAARARIKAAIFERQPVRRRDLRSLVILAACLASAITGGLFYARQARQEIARLRSQLVELKSRDMPELSIDQVQDSLEVFDQVTEYYDGHTAWLAMSGTDVQLGLNGLQAQATGGRAVVIRIGLADGAGQSNITTDVITHWGVTSTFRSVLTDGSAVEYEVIPLAEASQGALIQVRVRILGHVGGQGRFDRLISTVQAHRGEGYSLGVLRSSQHDWNVTLWAQWQEKSQQQPSNV